MNEDEIKELRNELETATAIDAVAISDGGKIIIKAYMADVVSLVDQFANKYAELSHIEFIALSAQLKEKLDAVRVLTRSQKNKEYLKTELDEALKS